MKASWQWYQSPIGLSRTSKVLIGKRIKICRDNPQRYRSEIQNDISDTLREIRKQESFQGITKNIRQKKHHKLLVIELRSIHNQYLRIIDNYK